MQADLFFVDCFFSVCGGNFVGYNMELHQVYGTAFPISNQFLLTAAHVLSNAKEEEYMAIGYDPKVGRALKAMEIIDYEIFNSVDLGIIKVKNVLPACNIFQFSTKVKPMLTNVKTGGYPYAFDQITPTLDIRAMKGYIVSSPSHNNGVNYYELSFHCPKGLSGAPLFISNEKTNPYIIGYIIGNRNIEMTVFSEKEFIKENGTEKIFEKTETTKFGMAVQLNSIANLYSRILNQTIAAFLKSENLLI